MILPIDQRGSAAAAVAAIASLSPSWIPRRPSSSATAAAKSTAEESSGAKWNYHRHQSYYSFCPLKTFYCKEIIKIRSGSYEYGTDRL